MKNSSPVSPQPWVVNLSLVNLRRGFPDPDRALQVAEVGATRHPCGTYAAQRHSEVLSMLITFSCPAYASITMFGDVGLKLIKLMGHSGTVPSAILADDVPAALAHLQAAVAADTAHDEDPPEVAATTDDVPAVSLTHRALPLIELLEAAVAQHCNVMWDSGS